MIDKIKGLFNTGDVRLITFEELDKTEYSKWIDLFSGKELKEGDDYKVRIKRILTKAAGQILILCDIKKFAEIDYHFHDCKETITVLEGSITINERQKLTIDQRKTFYAKTKHSLRADEDSKLIAELNLI